MPDMDIPKTLDAIHELAALVAKAETVQKALSIMVTGDLYGYKALELSIDRFNEQTEKHDKVMERLTCWITALTVLIAILTLLLALRTFNLV